MTQVRAECAQDAALDHVKAPQQQRDAPHQIQKNDRTHLILSQSWASSRPCRKYYRRMSWLGRENSPRKEAREGAEWIGSTGIRGALERVGLATYLFTGIQPATLFISADLM